MNFDRLKSVIHRRRRGAVALLGVVALIPLTAMFAANANSGQMIDERRQLQDAADALAMTHGAWTARSLNILSMNQINSIQLLSVAAGSEALEGAMQEIEFHALLVAVQLTAHGALHCWRGPQDTITWTPVCTGWHALIGIPALKAVLGTSFVGDLVPGVSDLLDFDPDDLTDEEKEAFEEAGLDDLDDLGIPTGLLSGKPTGVWDIRKKYAPKHGMQVSHKALAAIEGMNQAIISRFPQVMKEIGETYIAAHEVDDFHFNDPCNGPDLKGCRKTSTRDGMSLPLEKVPPLLSLKNGLDLSSAPDRARYCAAFSTGAPGLGPLALINTTFKARGFPANKGPLEHGGSRSTPNLKKYLNNKTSIGRILHDFKDFYKSSNILSHMPRHYTTPGLDKFKQWSNLIGTQRVNNNNSFTRRFSTKMATICSGVTLNEILPDFLPNPGDLPDLVPFKEMLTFDIQATLPTLYKLKDVPTLQAPPFVQPDQMPEAFHILALTQRKKGQRLASKVLTDTVKNHYGYGQVGVYNPDDASLYSQNWHYRLMPATRMDSATNVASDLRRQAPNSFSDLAQSLSGASHNTWARIHAH